MPKIWHDVHSKGLDSFGMDCITSRVATSGFGQYGSVSRKVDSIEQYIACDHDEQRHRSENL